MKNEDKRPLLQQEHQLQSKSCNSLFEKEEGKSKKYSDEGLTVAKCAVFIVAQVAGSGILALPNAISGTGWIGVCVLTTMCIMALYCGVMLGQCWLLIRDKVDEEHVRNPYPLIGQFAAGSMGKYLVEFCVIAGLFGSSVVYLLLSSQQVSSLVTLEFGSAVDSWNPFHSSEGQFRMWVLICGSTLIPLTWFSSPKEMWLVPCFSSLCIIVASTIIVTRTSLSIMRYGVAAVSARKDITVKSFFKSFGTIAFSYGGAIVFPTFQADMNQPPKFIYSAFLGFLFVYLLYLPVSVLPYIAYGSNIQDNILETLNALPGTGKGLVIAGEILVTFHLLFGIIILNNPISQQIEHHLNTNQKFGWRSVLIRGSVMVCVILIAELFPNFGPVLSFLGASTTTMLSFILPSIFFLLLKSSELVPWYQKVLHIVIILTAILCGSCGVYFAVQGFSNPFKSA